MPSIMEEKPLRKNYRKHLLRFFKKTGPTQTSGSIFAEKNDQGKKTNYELELLKSVDCFLDVFLLEEQVGNF